MPIAPRDLFLSANRLRHHLVEWGSGERLVLLLHGFLEHAHAWDFVAPRLAEAGYRVLALDFRGHGDSDWIGAGGYYHIMDYVADVAFLARALGPAPLRLVGHSLGGGIAVAYAGTEPARVSHLVSIEGLLLRDTPPDTVPERVATWIADLEAVARRPVRPFATLEEAAARLRERNPRFSEAIALHMARHATRRDPSGLVWKFDPLHQTRNPQPYYLAQARAFWHRVASPVLYVEGTEFELRLPEPDLLERLATLRAQRLTLAGCGHHPHLERPDELTQAILEFLA